MLKKIAALAGLLAFCAGTAHADDEKPAEKPAWKGPFGGTLTAGATFTTDYSYRGISQTQRQVAFQPTIGWESPQLSETAPISVYVGAWGSNVYFPDTGTAAEIDLSGGFRAKALGDKLSIDLGYIRYNYPGSAPELMLGFDEVGLVVGYDFGPVQLAGAVRYSPNFYANSGNAWYKWLQATVPLPFINFSVLGDPVTAKLWGTIGNQSVERYVNYGIPNNNYWDWQIGATVTVYGVDLSVAYTDTNIDVNGCLGTYNCEARVIFSISKMF